MTIALWIINVLLALFFLAAGLTKVMQPHRSLAESERMGWVKDVDPAVVKAIGIAEVLGALGLVLPLATGIAPVLAPVAAIGLAVVMVLASLFHLRRKESPAMPLGVLVVAVVSAVLGFLVVL